ncbi:evolutionarily conserved signaling intermediate in Toll pathway, mitochondrial [Carcharodon carcharias]|uniref:evolutionarily conserved signaling intermediate in Toll pathway, mitochondrial n=1 Tax=Carcharodon carcharias TaxID=13397 RepID=UPI001B7DF0AB|nr:evolutionarily conserved signaling intermediate in Toll pathway, mitochondrial [Carcharodon carcharias]
MTSMRRCAVALGPCVSACRRPQSTPQKSTGRINKWQSPPDCASRIHSSARTSKRPPTSFPELAGPKKEDGEGEGALVSYEDLFEEASRLSRTRDTYERVLRAFCRRDVRRRGHVEFIYMALRKMPQFGVERELPVYNMLLDVFPKEVFVPRSYIQRMFNHFPRQQECAVQVLEQMENYGILPNLETKALLMQIFGVKSHPMRKFQRLLYWFPRFKHVNPFPVPQPLPPDPVELARLSLQRIANDLGSRVTVYQEPRSYLGADGREIHLSHIVGIQSPDQRDLLAQHDHRHPVFVEGPFPLWLRRTCVHYYILRSDPLPPDAKAPREVDPERSLAYPLRMDFDLERDLGDDDELDVDEVDEGPVYAMCQVGSGDQASLAKWISGLQRTNPILGCTPVLFRVQPGPQELEETAGERLQPVEEPGRQQMQQ